MTRFGLCFWAVRAAVISSYLAFGRGRRTVISTESARGRSCQTVRERSPPEELARILLTTVSSTATNPLVTRAYFRTGSTNRNLWSQSLGNDRLHSAPSMIQEPDGNGLDRSNSMETEDAIKNTLRIPNQLPDEPESGPAGREKKLKKSLTDSAYFKMRNDARFTWLSILALSGSYAYAFISGDATFLRDIGVPPPGLFEGIVSVVIAIASAALAISPGGFWKQNKKR